MPPKTETAPTESRHFAITGFNPQPVRDLLSEYAECTEEITETEQLHEQLKTEVAQLQKKTKFTDKKQLEILSMKRLQIEMVPNKLEELSEQEAQLHAELFNVVSGGKLGLSAALSALLSSELRRVEKEMVAALAPVIGSEAEALQITQKSARYKRLQEATLIWHYQTTKAESIQVGLAILDRYNALGTLEETPAK